MASSFQLPTTTTTSLNSEQNNIQTLPPHQTSMATNIINPANHHNNTHYNTITNGNYYNNNTINNPKKRSLDYDYLSQNSPYFKMRAVVAELRPLVLKAILAPTMDACEARHGIQEKLELLLDQCRQQKTASVINCNGGTGRKHPDNGKQPEPKLPQLPRVNQEKRFPTGNGIVKQKHETQVIPGSYIVGGSAFGWNFLMFQGTKPEYYGRTKEAFRAGV
ncbi:uncharacterized protein LOC141605122 [Silene latifolia]|uniref:uncharacterized protein LOC141605122 n=1 Tax=Silene latifolia TaxID=37657 RepID=UPI003D770948